jgi:hypothetical protein
MSPGNSLLGIRIENAAVAGVEGETDFFFDRADPASLRMSIVRERMPKARRTVRAVRLSRFLKLDVEGAELEVVAELADGGK